MQYSWLERIIGFYLALPILIFLGGWCKLPIALCLCLLWFIALKPLLIDFPQLTFSPFSKEVILTLALAFGWCLFGGAGHFFYANKDWLARDAVLHDLIVGQWPISYAEISAVKVILRAPIGYYLPAALLGKFVGVNVAHFLLFLWTVVGVALFIHVATENLHSWKKALAYLLLISFSGMDIAGYFFMIDLFSAEHLEWWAHNFQYSSNTTLLFWVPNHALPGWLIAVLIYRRAHQANLIYILPTLIMSCLLWSPLTAIGLIPFALYSLWHQGRLIDWRRLLANPTWAAVLLAIVLAMYLTLDISGIPTGDSIKFDAEFYRLYLQFIILEFALLLYLLWCLRITAISVIAGLTLVLLPLFSFGQANDLVMRASIPALMVLCLFTMDIMLNAKRIEAVHIWVIAILFIGAITPTHELIRAIVMPRWSPYLTYNLLEMNAGNLPAHYFGHLNHAGLKALLKEPIELQNSTVMVK